MKTLVIPCVATCAVGMCCLVGSHVSLKQPPGPDQDDGATPLHEACEDQDRSALAVIERLLAEGADPNARTRDGRTPLMVAARWNPEPRTIELLLNAKGDMNASDQRGLTVLHYATGFTQEPRDPQTIALLVEAGAKTDVRTKNGWTPVMASALAPGCDPLEAFLQNIANEAGDEHAVHALVNHSLPDGWTPLMLAVASVTPEVWIRWNTELGMEVGKDAQGDRMVAGMQAEWAKFGYVGRVWTLLNAGADPNARARDGTSVDALLEGRNDAESQAIRALIAIARQQPDGNKMD